MAKQTTITVETRSLLILCSRNSTEAWCPVCRAQVEMVLLGPAHAPALTNWLDADAVHRVESADGSLLLCLHSLLALAQNSEPVSPGIRRWSKPKKEIK